jgi:hypothetical protein
MLVEVGVAVALLGGGAWWALRARRRHEHDLLDAMRARKYGFGRLAPLRGMDDDLPTVGLGLAMLGPLFADLDEARQQERLDREARRRLEALELHLNPPHLEAEDPEAPDVPQAPDLDALVAIALKERSHHITEVNEGMERHARGAVFEENVGLGVRIEEVDVEDTTIEDRVAREGGAAGQVQISLAWEDRNDLDLHVYAPSGERIYFNNRKSACGGVLDVDMNAQPTSSTPVENVVWAKDAPSGTYRVGVHFYRHHRRRGTNTTSDYTLRTTVFGEVAQFSGTLKHGDPMQLVTSFTLPDVEEE